MSERPTETARTGWTLTLLLLLALAVAGVFALVQLSAPGAAESLAALRSAAALGRFGPAFASALESGLLPWLLVPTIGPLLVAIAVLIAMPRRRSAKVVEERAGGDPAEAPAAATPPEAGGLRLLATLQEEARLLDFVREDITGYSDEQVGAAVRGIHAALRKSLDERLDIAPILPGEEGDEIEVPQNLPAGQLRLTGRVPGAPPFRGILRHAGWRASSVHLPQPVAGSDPAVLAPAEVEVGEG